MGISPSRAEAAALRRAAVTRFNIDGARLDGQQGRETGD
jgi:hypothetical protein